MKHPITYILAIIAMFAFFTGSAVAQTFEGRSKCSSCHKAQAKSWHDTAHAKAMRSLRPGAREEAKVKAGLDPVKTTPKTLTALAVTLMVGNKEVVTQGNRA